jgi:hypothetical protein
MGLKNELKGISLIEDLVGAFSPGPEDLLSKTGSSKTQKNYVVIENPSNT